MKHVVLFFRFMLITNCVVSQVDKIPIIVDTDTNNELDDQHALAYLFFNEAVFDIKGITTNATSGGGQIQNHQKEAKRVMQLCNVWETYPLLKGANKNFDDIEPTMNSTTFDGSEAVDFIINEALKNKNGKLVLAPIGKLTNMALAVKKEPKIKDKIKIVWLGTNYPKAGEYNLENDISSVNYLLNQNVDFEMVVVRYFKQSGADLVRVTPKEITEKLAGKGPKVEPVAGRHGGVFTTFGDYAVNLFSKIYLSKKRPSRALYDLVSLAIIKNESWGTAIQIPAPHLVNNQWEERPDNKRKIIIWQHFNKNAILSDFFESITQAH